MVIGLYTNLERDIDSRITNKMIAMLNRRKVGHRIIPEYSLAEETPSPLFLKRADECDLIISFGGDGTVLRLAQGLTILGVPVMGVNLGHLGFLTECNVDEMESCLDSILKGDYQVQERAVLEVRFGDECRFAINDVTLNRGVSLHTIDVDVFVDDGLSDRIKGDGVLISTPLGSTAYSLSCGGPILSPDLKALTVIAICPHSLHSRPMVITDNSTITLSTTNKSGSMRISVDSSSYPLPQGKVDIIVKKASHKSNFVRIKKENFYKKLINKLYHWNDLNKREC